MGYINDVKEFLKIIIDKPIVFFFVSILSGSFLFLPDKIISIFGFSKFIEGYRPIIGLFFFISIVLIFTFVILSIIRHLRQNFRASKLRKSILETLTSQERKIIKRYTEEDLTSIKFDPSDGVIGGLVRKGVLFRSASMGIWDSFPYNVEPWVLEELKRKKIQDK